ncbi:nucleotidyltransferase domain-containing protein [Bacteroidota bacterium]
MKRTHKNIQVTEIGTLARSIIKTLAYYDIFNYPLTKEEIYSCSITNGDTKASVFDKLELLVASGIIYNNDKFYSINHNSQLIPKRIEGNKRAINKMKTAKLFSKFISHFPFVRCVLLSGSISKGYMDEKADIDYFIITGPDRLWIARIMLVFFKKLFLLNSYKFFCINYFISTSELKIEEKNIYTAIELATLIPMYGADVYNKFYAANQWIKTYVPNYPKRDVANLPPFKKKVIQTVIESLLNRRFGDYIDDKVMKLFVRFDEKRYGKLDEGTFRLAFKTRKNISKHHPNFFQKRVLESLRLKLEQLESKHNIVFGELD